MLLFCSTNSDTFLHFQLFSVAAFLRFQMFVNRFSIISYTLLHFRLLNLLSTISDTSFYLSIFSVTFLYFQFLFNRFSTVSVALLHFQQSPIHTFVSQPCPTHLHFHAFFNNFSIILRQTLVHSFICIHFSIIFQQFPIHPFIFTITFQQSL